MCRNERYFNGIGASNASSLISRTFGATCWKGRDSVRATSDDTCCVSFANLPFNMLGKRCASEMEACLTEYYRQECLRALYAKQERPRDCAWVNKDMMAKSPRQARKGVSFAITPEIIGCADPTVDRSPIDVSPISKFELIVLLSQRTFPVQA